MPHIVIDYSPNLETLVDFPALLEALRVAAVNTGVFPLGGIRIRAHRADHCVVADGNPKHGFLDATLKMGTGRDLETRKKAGEAVFAVLSQQLEPAFAKTTISLSLEIKEIDPDLSWRKNSIHDALKKGG